MSTVIAAESPSRRPAAPTSSSESDAVSFKTWIAVFGATLGSFMAIINIQIVNASLADIQGGIGAGVDDGAWIATSYLVAEIVVIPLTAWLEKVFSLRRYILTSAILFLIFSAACASAHNLGQMIVLRAFQGFFGGVLIPLAFTIVITTLPKSKQPIGLALFALSATFAPAIGPTVGGYLTENFGWQYIFYVNLVPGLLMVGMLWYSLERSPMRLSLLRKGDWLGILTMAVGLGCLQTVLEEGNKDDWLGSDFIVRLSVIAGIALLLFVWIELRRKEPLLNLRLLVQRNFGLGIVANFLLGGVLYGSIFILPEYLSHIQGYNAEQIGEVLVWTGLPQLILLPFVPKLVRRYDIRLVIALGFAIFAFSNFLNVDLNSNYAGPQLIEANVIRALGQALCYAPLSMIATAGIARADAGSASALFNMTRNLGGAFGIALLQAFLTRREHFHSNVLVQSVSGFSEATRARIDQLTKYFLAHGTADHATALHDAVVAIGRIVRREAYIMAFSDVFYLLGAALIIALVATLLLKKPDHAAADGA
ncbi:MAG TPA: MDR family MFS transporter [Alphaproteobacteria bacterium]|nr:MDR family MFS transporter [Alphaproteobacteria bacterium]